MYSTLRASFAPVFSPVLRTVSAVFTTTTRKLRLRRSYASMAAHATVNTTARLQALRELMAKPEYDVQAVVVPSEDQHFSEYIAQCDERRAFISGFNGSAGCAVVTPKGAYLFTDGRYFLQAEKQLDENWTLMKQGLPDVPTWQEFLSKNLDSNTRIGIDPTLISASDAETIQKALEPKKSQLVSLSKNLVDLVWSDRPSRPANKIFPLDVKYAGKSHSEKLKILREELKKKDAKSMVVNMLDEVAWLFNLRGSDIDYNPVFFAYGLINGDKTLLFVNQSQFDDSVRQHLRSEVEVHPYDTFFSYLTRLGSELNRHRNAKVLISDKASLAVAEAIGKDNIIVTRSPVTDLKAIKNDVEIEGFRQSHIRDGAALVRYFAWLEEQLNAGAVLNESQAADQLEKYRSENESFKGLSFPTISATGPNGAIIHYQPEHDDCAVVKKDQIYLCDSGAQYLDGTTDVTRTYHFGTPTPEEKRAFTRVLQGHIAIDVAVFPSGTTGYLLDPFARRPLWEDGLDYRHGTGHGVGHFLNVHEGPHGIGVRITYNSTPLKPCMTVSNEPGYYADGRYGIRIENIVIVREAHTPNNFGDKGYLRFEHVTLCPMGKTLIDVSLLTAKEKEWLNAYHEEIQEKVAPLLKTDERALKWLQRECSPL
ncbi:Creatinase/aminopeptidase [Dichomitus squalens LYAD-421 SS1]|uniref:Creatinase/aminopeptidase n=1 Tax=Dichomitus squalens (strain LYAD-421) TaxID=732165 RepID=UPI0004412B40|nr:Creatinase/aminopeptidase [Dichomitus squalens LYAD-421 SS1]EJF63579.1 Creatinase/aminopeptidase [Dichomitus squalens LYAD-421 SS1]